MRARVEKLALALALGLASAGAFGQMPGAMEGPPPNSGAPGPKSDPLQRAMADNMAAIGPLKVTFGKKSAEWTPATLAALPHTTITVFNEHAKVNQTYSGVVLMDLLTRLGVPDKPHGKDLRLYLVAEGATGTGRFTPWPR